MLTFAALTLWTLSSGRAEAIKTFIGPQYGTCRCYLVEGNCSGSAFICYDGNRWACGKCPPNSN